MSIQQSTTDHTLYATAYNDDGTIKTDLAFNETSISVVVVRDGQLDSSAITLSSKATKDAAHSPGGFFNHGRGVVSIDVADSFFTATNRRVALAGTFDGGYLVGEPEQVVAFDPNAVAVGANTTTPPTAAANATAVRTELATELGRIDEPISDPKTLTTQVFGDLFADTDAATALAQQLSDVLAGVSALFDESTDTAPQVIAALVLSLLKSDATYLEIQADAEASRAQAVANGTAISNLASQGGALTSDQADTMSNLRLMIDATAPTDPKYTQSALANVASSGSGGGSGLSDDADAILDALNSNQLQSSKFGGAS